MMDSVISVRLGTELLDEVDAAVIRAAREGVITSRSKVIRRILREHLGLPEEESDVGRTVRPAGQPDR